jgi:acetyltransferase-like isoleucine patch superfamily enzyme/acyl carrier protein
VTGPAANGREHSGWLRGVCTSLGEGASLTGSPKVINEGRLVIGARFRFASTPVRSHLVTYGQGALEIGDDVTISYGAAVYCEAGVRIGSGTRIGPYVSLSDSDFHQVGNRNARPEPRPVEIGRGVKIGARVTILPGARIGDGATVIAGSTVAGTVPAGAVVSGVPALVQRTQAGPASEDLRALVARTLGLASLPSLEDGPAQIPEWDSLGALRLLLAIEAELGVRLDEQAMAGAKRVADLVALAGLTAGSQGAGPGTSAAAGGAKDASPIGALVQRTLDLPALPALTDGPAQLPQWDSLGALRLLLAIEQEFQVRLDEGEIAKLQSIAELTAAVARARARQV